MHLGLGMGFPADCVGGDGGLLTLVARLVNWGRASGLGVLVRSTAALVNESRKSEETSGNSNDSLLKERGFMLEERPKFVGEEYSGIRVLLKVREDCFPLVTILSGASPAQVPLAKVAPAKP